MQGGIANRTLKSHRQDTHSTTLHLVSRKAYGLASVDKLVPANGLANTLKDEYSPCSRRAVVLSLLFFPGQQPHNHST